MNLGIHYKNEEIEELYKKAGVMTEGSSGFDLIAIEDHELAHCEFKLIDLGVIIDIPEGYEALLMPRSSTYKKYGLIQTNSIGLIDNDYCGKDDWWKIPVLCVNSSNVKHENFQEFKEAKQDEIGDYFEFIQRRSVIKKGDRICQFILKKKEVFNVVKFTPGEESRGGFGSSDKKLEWLKQ